MLMVLQHKNDTRELMAIEHSFISQLWLQTLHNFYVAWSDTVRYCEILLQLTRNASIGGRQIQEGILRLITEVWYIIYV